jgi:hypothetical protein
MFCNGGVVGVAVAGAAGEEGINAVGLHRHASPIVNEANTRASDLRREVFEVYM